MTVKLSITYCGNCQIIGIRSILQRAISYASYYILPANLKVIQRLEHYNEQEFIPIKFCDILI